MSVRLYDAYPLLVIKWILTGLPRARFILTSNLRSGKFHWTESKVKSASTVPGRRPYQFVTMSFGSCNAFQTIPGWWTKSSLPIGTIGDFLFITKTFDQYLLYSNLTMKFRNSKFVIKEIQYLEYIIGNGMICTDPDKLHVIYDFLRWEIVKRLQWFLVPATCAKLCFADNSFDSHASEEVSVLLISRGALAVSPNLSPFIVWQVNMT